MSIKIDNLPDIKVLSEAEFADLIGVSAMTLQRMRHEGQAPARVQLTARRRGYTVKAIREWLAKRIEVAA
jgi:predicted DNA-binding transcriptional regulator AlpA